MFAGKQVGRALLVGVAAAVFAAACGDTGAGSASPAPVDVGSGSLTGAGRSQQRVDERASVLGVHDRDDELHPGATITSRSR